MLDKPPVREKPALRRAGRARIDLEPDPAPVGPGRWTSEVRTRASDLVTKLSTIIHGAPRPPDDTQTAMYERLPATKLTPAQWRELNRLADRKADPDRAGEVAQAMLRQAEVASRPKQASPRTTP